MQTRTVPASHDFLLGGGEMGELIRSVNWSKTPVGSVESWPQSLRTAVSIMLNTHFPMYIAWGQDFTQFYNDGYRPILGSTKHPAAMGRSTKFTFAEIWNIIGPMFEGVLEGQAVGFTDFMLPLDRHGFTEECYFIFSYSPIKQEDGSTGGVLVTVTETSERVLGERRLETLRNLGDRTYECKSTTDTLACVVEVLDKNKHDIPFSLLYSFDNSEKKYILKGCTGVESDEPSISIENAIEFATKKPLIVFPISEIISEIQFKDERPWPETSQYCCAVFLSRPDQADAFGLLVLGLSPRLRYDNHYRNFFKLLNDQIVIALSNANAFEEERKRVEALAEIDRAKTAFFSNISHEFRTPLTLMLGPLEELLNNPLNLEQKQVENVEAAHRNSIRLLRLVNTLLDFSKIESGRLEATFHMVNLKVFTEEIASNFRSLIEKAGLTLHLDLQTGTDSVYLDYDMWEKVVFNLLSNAFKYTLKGSISLSLEQRGRNVVFSVQDTGVGIPQSELPRMFERFHRIPNTAGRSYEGTGIGLSLVAELVKIHQGTITVNSKVGEGSTFTVTIPTGHDHLASDKISHVSKDFHISTIADSFTQEAALIAGEELSDQAGLYSGSHENSGKATSILIVDDNVDMIKYLVRILEPQYRIVTASNGHQALEKIIDKLPDLILSDIMMPGMDGVELLKRIKSNPETSSIPVMLLSARAGEESRIEGYDVGADDYLIKPFSAKELQARVKAQINISKTRTHLNTLLKKVFEQTPAAITIIRKENYVVEFANDLYLQIVDKERDFIGKSLFDSLPQLKGQVGPLLDKVMATSIPYEGKEFEIDLHRYGKWEKTYFNFVYHPLREQDGSITGVIVVCFEVTDLVVSKNNALKSEAELEQKVKERTAELEEKNELLLKANRELEQFAYIASHDLQEPLRKIRTFSSILQKNFPYNAQSTSYFEKIHSASDRMGKLIKDVLNYSKLANQNLSFVTIDLNQILDSVLLDFELLIEERKAKIIAEQLPTIKGVELQLQQLFANLLSNALKFSGNNPIVKISSKKLTQDDLRKYHPQADAEAYVEIRLEDNGIGFDPKYAEQIFVIFQRLHDKETTGTGIGLALCKKIIENHHGFIRAESSPGNGATFFISLPAV
jgi:signal transduction histidine kinase/CheY-like chemotaxis protein